MVNLCGQLLWWLTKRLAHYIWSNYYHNVSVYLHGYHEHCNVDVRLSISYPSKETRVSAIRWKDKHIHDCWKFNSMFSVWVVLEFESRCFYFWVCAWISYFAVKLRLTDFDSFHSSLGVKRNTNSGIRSIWCACCKVQSDVLVGFCLFSLPYNDSVLTFRMEWYTSVSISLFCFQHNILDCIHCDVVGFIIHFLLAVETSTGTRSIGGYL